MKYINKQLGFTAVELLITLFIAAVFLLSGLQLYASIIKTSGETRFQTNANNVIYDYMQRYKSATTNPCTAQTPLTNVPITVAGLSDVTITVVISCPYSLTTSVSKILATILYDDPQQTVSNATYINLPGTTDGLVLNLDAGISTSYTGTGTVWYDLSGNGYNGTLVNGTGYTNTNGGALIFNGSSNYVNVPGNIALEPKSITVSAWIKMDTGAPTARNIFLTKWSGYSCEIEDTTRRPYFRLTGVGDVYSTDNLILSNWYYFVGTFDKGVGSKIYLNGVLKGTLLSSSDISYDANSVLNIGRYSGGIYFKGSISDVRIYDRALNTNEIQQNFNALRGRYGI